MTRLYRYGFVLILAAGMLVVTGGDVMARFRLFGRRRSDCGSVAVAPVDQKSTAPAAATPLAPTPPAPPPAVAEIPSPSDKPLVKEKAPLPKDVTEITKEDLLKRTPNFFAYDYAFEPEPGKRYWLRVSDEFFIERYPSGKETRLDILGRSKIEDATGTVVGRVAEDGKHDGFQVFISDRTLEARPLYFRLPSVNDGKWVLLGEMKSVE
jgi:hypothetical protein